jgi:very-short-patch-repair endonuclease
MAGFKFRRQHLFGKYILDFACLKAMLVVELDGGQHGLQERQDSIRTEYLRRAGFRVLRFWNDDVLHDTDAVAEAIWKELMTHPHPNPPLEGEGI